MRKSITLSWWPSLRTRIRPRRWSPIKWVVSGVMISRQSYPSNGLVSAITLARCARACPVAWKTRRVIWRSSWVWDRRCSWCQRKLLAGSSWHWPYSTFQLSCFLDQVTLQVNSDNCRTCSRSCPWEMSVNRTIRAELWTWKNFTKRIQRYSVTRQVSRLMTMSVFHSLIWTVDMEVPFRAWSILVLVRMKVRPARKSCKNRQNTNNGSRKIAIIRIAHITQCLSTPTLLPPTPNWMIY